MAKELETILKEGEGAITRVASATATVIGSITHIYELGNPTVATAYIVGGSSLLLYSTLKYMIKRRKIYSAKKE